jgi:uncharacterized membrane protein
MSNGAPNAGQGTAGVGVFVAAYVDERGADQALEDLKQAKRDGQFYFDDAAVVRRDAKGKVHMNETGDMSTGKGAGIGALVGGIIGLLGGPAGVVVGAGAGAAIGGIAAHHDAGFDNESLKEIGGALPSGTSALAVTTSQDFVEAVRAQSPQEETLSLARDIATEINDRLNARQDVLMAMVLTEEGVAASEVISSPSEVAAFGIKATQEGVVARAGVATPEGVAVVDASAVPVDAAPEENDTAEEAEEPSDS